MMEMSEPLWLTKTKLHKLWRLDLKKVTIQCLGYTWHQAIPRNLVKVGSRRALDFSTFINPFLSTACWMAKGTHATWSLGRRGYTSFCWTYPHCSFLWQQSGMVGITSGYAIKCITRALRWSSCLCCLPGWHPMPTRSTGPFTASCRTKRGLYELWVWNRSAGPPFFCMSVELPIICNWLM